MRLAVALGIVLSACAGTDSEPPAADAGSTTVPASTVVATTAAPQPTTASTARPTSTTPDTTASVVVETTSATAVSATCSDLPIGVTDYTLDAGGAVRDVRVFVPSAFDGSPLATVIDWHGLGSDGPQQAAVSGYEDVAEAEGFIVVHPTGVPAPGDSRNSWQLFATQDGRDDVAFASALIDDLIANWCADATRIYSTGMSNGGFFTARLVCELSDRIAAASSVAGLYHPDACAPERPVPYIAFHGTDDRIVPFDGSGESLLLTGGPLDDLLRVFFEQVMPDEFGEFAADNACDAQPTVAQIGDDVTEFEYTGCEDGVPMAFFEIDGGGHTWPSWAIADAVDGALGYTTFDVDATADSWAFFEQHRLDD
jgi:polyhydroxybutyrate depolymerase